MSPHDIPPSSTEAPVQEKEDALNDHIDRCPVPLPYGAGDLFRNANPTRFGKASDEELADHITIVRDKIFAHKPFSCLGAFRFIETGIRTAGPPGTYDEVLKLLKTPVDPNSGVQGPRLHLDMGCNAGHEIRALIADGIPGKQIIGGDLQLEYLRLGLELFGDDGPGAVTDGEWIKAAKDSKAEDVRFTKFDVFDAKDVDKLREVSKPYGGFSTIYIGSFLHLFPLKEQRQVVQVISSLLSQAPGSIVFGRQMGQHEGVPARAQDMTVSGRTDIPQEPTFVHDEQSFKELLWDWEVAERKDSGAWQSGWSVTTWTEMKWGRKRLENMHVRKLGFKVVRTPAND